MAIPKLALIPSTVGGSVYSVLPSNGDGDFDFTRASAATRINAQGLIETVAVGDNRLNYPLIDGVVSGCPSLLLEPSRTNSITYSNDFSQSIYGKNDLTITANQGISPDGTQNANLLVPNAAVGNRYLSNNTGSNLKINTVFLKKKELRYVRFGNAQSVVLVDLENGTISADSVSTNNFTIENYGNGWYRVSCYNTLDVNLQIQIFFGIDGSGSNIATNGTDGVYIYGFEIQNGSYATSYIPTSGTTATRSAETCNNAGDVNTFNDSEGVLFAEISVLANDGTNRYFSLSDGSISNRVNIFFDSNSKLRGYYNGLSGSIIINIDTTVNNKIAFKYKSGDSAFWVNGIEVATRADSLSLVGLNSISFDLGGGSDFYGNTKQIQYFDLALNDSELETLTSWVSFTDMANGQLYTIQ